MIRWARARTGDPRGAAKASSLATAEIRDLAARDPHPVLLTGECGSGKGRAARLLHQLGPRSRGPFVHVRCGELDPASSVGSLFGTGSRGDESAGHESRGAADPSLLESARGGTLFLDAMDRLTSEAQFRLVPALERGTAANPPGPRVIAAVHGDPDDLVRDGSLHPELRQLLAANSLHLPPLREWPPEDRVALVHRIARELRTAMGMRPGDISPECLNVLLGNRWPGNIRELRNALERALLNAGDSEVLRTRHLPAMASAAPTPMTVPATARFQPESIEAVERRHIEAVLRHHAGNRTRAARDLGIARGTLINKIKLYGLGL